MNVRRRSVMVSSPNRSGQNQGHGERLLRRSQSEHVQHRRSRGVLELGKFRQRLLRLLRSYEYRDILLAVDRVGDRRSVDAGARVEAPEFLQGLGVERVESAVERAVEDEIAGGRKRAAVVGILHLKQRLGLAGQRIDCLYGAIALLRERPGGAAGKALAPFHATALVLEVLLLHCGD